MSFKSTRKLVFVSSMTTLLTTACGENTSLNWQAVSNYPSQLQKSISRDNVVQADSANVDRAIGDEQTSYQILNETVVQQKLSTGELTLASSLSDESLKQLGLMQSSSSSTTLRSARQQRSPRPRDTRSLVVTLPQNMVNKRFIIGSVFTAVSDPKSEVLGRLKLDHIEPIHATSRLARVSGSQDVVLAFAACAKNCTAQSQEQDFFAIPVTSVNQQSGQVVLDLAAMGESLNLVAFDGLANAMLTTDSVKVTLADFSDSTLVFDMQHKVKTKNTDIPGIGHIDGGQALELTSRWSLRLESTMDTRFVSRPLAPEAGFFTTARRAQPVITRFLSKEDVATAEPAHYYMKNVPEAQKADLAAAFEEWNDFGRDLLGHPLFTYQFIDRNDADNDLIVVGDVRHNVVEWDLFNLAPYGGLGPSQASQLTGQNLAAHVLVQGPKIVETYTKWFQVSQRVQRLIAQGDQEGADRLSLEFSREMRSQLAAPKATVTASLGDLQFTSPSADERLHDPIAKREDFTPLPANLSYAEYMKGYWKDLLGHELGHNLGLRHNFRGNLFADASGNSPSASIMEYLGRLYRNKSSVAEYDRMAIAYGYQGVRPTRADQFCTDESVPSEDNPKLSPECSRDDATSDPYAEFRREATRAVDLLIAPASQKASDWASEDVTTQMDTFVNGMLYYATAAESTSARWTNWNKPGRTEVRPTDAAAIKALVLKEVRNLQCRSEIANAEQVKTTAADKAATKAKLADLKAYLNKRAVALGLPANTLNCQ